MNFINDFVPIFFQSKMPGIKDMIIYIFNVLFEGFRATFWKKSIIFSPYHQYRRLVVSKILLPLRVQLEVVLIIIKQVQVHLVGLGARHAGIIQVPAIRVYIFGVAGTMGILPFETLQRKRRQQGLLSFGVSVGPQNP